MTKSMEKPIVFLSHSAKDKPQLAVIKELLDKRAAGSLEFFLSSDGQSIRFGRNWVVRVSDALAESKLMFVFLSPESADSKWIHFEAGCAYSKDIQVVPVCLPGMDFNRVTSPLSLLQGFNLHSHEAIGNLARTCNETFQLRMEEAFSPEDFRSIFAHSESNGRTFFGESSWAINDIWLDLRISTPENEIFDPLSKLQEICGSAGMECLAAKGKNSLGQLYKRLEWPGCYVYVAQLPKPPTKPALANVVDHASPTPQTNFQLHCDISPQLFHLSAPLLDQWFVQVPLCNAFAGTIEFKGKIIAETIRHNLTTKLYKSGIRLVDGQRFEFSGLTFTLSPRQKGTSNSKYWCLHFLCEGNLYDKRLSELVDCLLKCEVLHEDPYWPEP